MTAGELERRLIAVQHGLHNHSNLDIFEETTAAVLSLSQIADTFPHFCVNYGDPEAMHASVGAMPLTALQASFFGTIAHELMRAGRVFYRIEKLGMSERQLHPNSYWLWQSPAQQAVTDYILSYSLPVDGAVTAYDRTASYISEWRRHQDWTYDAKDGGAKEHPVYPAGAREEVWNSYRLTKKLNQIRANLHTVETNSHARPDNPILTDELLEVPINLYLSTLFNHISPDGSSRQMEAKLMSWVQPDLVTICDGQVFVKDYKFGAQSIERDGLDIFDWIQITLLAVAGKSLADQYLWSRKRRTKQLDKPAFTRLWLDEIPQYIENVTVRFEDPTQLVGKGEFVGTDVTPDSNQLGTILYVLEAIMRVMADSHFRGAYYAYRKLVKSARKGQSPEVSLHPEVQKQAILLPDTREQFIALPQVVKSTKRNLTKQTA